MPAAVTKPALKMLPAALLLAGLSSCSDRIDNSYFDAYLDETYNTVCYWDPDSLAFTRVEWSETNLGDGATLSTGSAEMWESKQSFSVIKYSPATLDTRVRCNDKQSQLADASAKESALFAVNGASADYLMIDNKVVKEGSDLAGKALLAMSDESLVVLPCPSDLSILNGRYTTALVSGDLIVDRGETKVEAGEEGERVARTIIGTDKRGNSVIMLMNKREGVADGVTLAEAAFVARVYGLQYAMALDSDDAAAMWTRESGNVNVPGGRVTDNFICICKTRLFASGTGEEDSPYVIATRRQLQNMKAAMKTGVITYFRLENDIDMAPVTDWEPVNNGDCYIDFNGNGHTISNFSCTEGANSSFFGTLLGKVYKLRFENASVSNTRTGIAGIVCAYLGNSVGYNSLAEEIYVNGTLTINLPGWGSDNIDPHGAIAGRVYYSTVRNCYADVKITRPADSWGNCGTGGIVGDVVQGATVEYCYATGEIDASGNGNCGAIVGRGLDWAQCRTSHYRVDNNIGWMRRINGNGASGRVAGRMLLFRGCDKDAGEYNGTFGANYGWVGTDMCGNDYTETDHPDDGARDGLDGTDIIQVAKTLGWSTRVWNLSGEYPRFNWE